MVVQVYTGIFCFHFFLLLFPTCEPFPNHSPVVGMFQISANFHKCETTTSFGCNSELVLLMSACLSTTHWTLIQFPQANLSVVHIKGEWGFSNFYQAFFFFVEMQLH